MKVLLLILMLPSLCEAKDQISEAKESIKTLITPLIRGEKSKSKFRVDSCQTEKIDWTKVLMNPLSSHPVNYKFKEGCDVEGTVRLKAFDTFPAEFKLRNLDSYNKLVSQNKLDITLEAKPLLGLNILNGELTGKNKVKFKATYKVRLNPTSKNGIQENLGGTITFTEINGKSTNLTEKIHIK